MKSYEIIVEVDGKIDRLVVDADTPAKAKKQLKEQYPDKTVEFIMVKQVV
ncbi:MAG: hypothetical protein J6K51_04425 [Clostridia bacterium]|nr:hypothetical protein [Clostridia bacterium]MBP3448245.1 hypothetical protein [Clostridia bacterium]